MSGGTVQGLGKKDTIRTGSWGRGSSEPEDLPARRISGKENHDLVATVVIDKDLRAFRETPKPTSDEKESVAPPRRTSGFESGIL